MMTNPDLMYDVLRSRQGAPLLASSARGFSCKSMQQTRQRENAPRSTEATMWQLTARYARYALSAFAAVGFAIN